MGAASEKSKPHQFSTVLVFVLVNGQLALADDKISGARCWNYVVPNFVVDGFRNFENHALLVPFARISYCVTIVNCGHRVYKWQVILRQSYFIGRFLPGHNVNNLIAGSLVSFWERSHLTF